MLETLADVDCTTVIISNRGHCNPNHLEAPPTCTALTYIIIYLCFQFFKEIDFKLILWSGVKFHEIIILDNILI